MPGKDIGIVMRKNEPSRVQPSIMALSSSSLGMPSKKPINIHTTNGMLKVI